MRLAHNLKGGDSLKAGIPGGRGHWESSQGLLPAYD